MVFKLGSPQPVLNFHPLDEIPDEADDKPDPGSELTSVGPWDIPSLVFGGASMSGFYNDDDHIGSTTPLRTVRLAFRYGIRAIDTSPYYGPSEIVVGNVLRALEPEFPRASYQLITKCGRYGSAQENYFDYSPATIRASIERSLQRLHTNYLDVVYLHDTEFVATFIGPRGGRCHLSALKAEKMQYGLSEDQEGIILGDGDRKILEGFSELAKLKDEGIIRRIGLSGYPLPTLLRVALLILHQPPYKPVDVIMSYSHLNLQNMTLAAFLPQFLERAHVAQLVTASPLNMGLLTPTPPPWHPAPSALRDAVQNSLRVCAGWTGGLPNLAIGYATRESGARGLPLVVGLSSRQEVHESMRLWREIQAEKEESADRRGSEERVMDVFRRAGYFDWSWATA